MMMMIHLWCINLWTRHGVKWLAHVNSPVLHNSPRKKILQLRSQINLYANHSHAAFQLCDLGKVMYTHSTNIFEHLLCATHCSVNRTKIVAPVVLQGEADKS